MQALRVAHGVDVKYAFQREGAFTRLRARLRALLLALPALLAQLLVFRKVRQVRSLLPSVCPIGSNARTV